MFLSLRALDLLSPPSSHKYAGNLAQLYSCELIQKVEAYGPGSKGPNGLAGFTVWRQKPNPKHLNQAVLMNEVPWMDVQVKLEPLGASPRCMSPISLLGIFLQNT